MFRREFSKGLEAYKSRLAWADRSFSDPIAYLNAYRMYQAFDQNGIFSDRLLAEKWCKQNFLQYRRIREAEFLRNELFDRLSRLNIFRPNRPNKTRSDHEEELILKVLRYSYYITYKFI